MEARGEDDFDMVTSELEAAEALAGLGRPGGPLKAAITTETSVQDPAIAVRESSRYASNTATCEEAAQTAGYRSNHVGKSKQSLNEAEREARKLRRILANRESARQTIRRRQALYLDLTKKAADLLEENENLKKEKELAVVKFNSLKDRNDLLKTHMMKLKKTERRDRQVATKSSDSEISTTCPTNSPIFLCNQPSVVPCFWPSILPSSDVMQFHCPSHTDVMGSSQFLVPHIGAQGQDNSMGPIFVLPVPWMLPYLSPAGMYPTNDRQHEPSTTYQCSNTCSSSDTLHREENNHFSLNQRTMSVGEVHGAKFTFPPDSIDQCPGDVSPPEILRHAFSQISGTQTSTVSTTEHMAWSLSNKNRELHVSPKRLEDVFSATEARRRRKELMRLKNSNCYYIRQH